MWPSSRRRPTTEANDEDEVIFSSAALNKSTKKLGRTAAARPASAETRDDAMDALDGLLASLDEERSEKAEADFQTEVALISPPRSRSRAPSPISPPREASASDSARRPRTAPVQSKLATSTKPRPPPYEEEFDVASPQPFKQRRCGIAPVQKRMAMTGKLWDPMYDDEYTVPSLQSSFEILDGSSVSAGVYCPLSPTIMSVHLPGSPIAKAVDLDDTASSVVILGEPQKSRHHAVGPSRVRFELRSSECDKENNKHEPQAPSKKRLGTGRLVSRPLGCTVVQANFGGA
jgi:hypothetical protein